MRIGRRRAAESWQSSAKLSFAIAYSLAITLLPRFIMCYTKLSNFHFSRDSFPLLSILPILLSLNLDSEHLLTKLVHSSMNTNVE